jgi:hypothetical protein
MYNFILQIVAVLSGAVIIYVLSRGLKRVEENVGEPSTPFFVVIDKWLNKLPLKRFDEWILGFLGKFLRKIRVINLKIENAVNSGIGKLRHEENTNLDKN